MRNTDERMRPSRRRVLRGIGGAAVGLPLLQSLSRTARAAEPPRRFVAFWTGCGVDITRFWPATPWNAPLTDASFAGRGIEPLRPWKAKLLIPRGIQSAPRGYNADNAQNGANDHMIGTAARLTAASLQAGRDHFANGISVDQEMARRINPKGRPSLTLGIGRHLGGADGNISYLAPGRPAPRINDPWTAFKDFMGLGGGDPAVAAQLLARRRSVLDLVRADMESLKRSPRLGQADRAKLDLHFSGIRELETGMAQVGATACSLPEATVGEMQNIPPAKSSNDNFRLIGRLQMETIVVALACGHTNVATVMWGSGEAGPTFLWLGHTVEHHLISHRVVSYTSSTPLEGALDLALQADRWYAEQLAGFLAKLDAFQEGERTLLDNTAVVWMNELSNGRRHDYRDLPFVIAGSAGGYFKQGQYIKVAKGELQSFPGREPLIVADDAPHNMLLTMLLNAVGARTDTGAPYEKFGMYGLPGEFTALRA